MNEDEVWAAINTQRLRTVDMLSEPKEVRPELL